MALAGLDIAKMRGIGTDGASTMTGCHNRVVARLKTHTIQGRSQDFMEGGAGYKQCVRLRAREKCLQPRPLIISRDLCLRMRAHKKAESCQL